MLESARPDPHGVTTAITPSRALRPPAGGVVSSISVNGVRAAPAAVGQGAGQWFSAGEHRAQVPLHIDVIDARIAVLSEQISARTEPFGPVFDLLLPVPGL